MIKLYPFQEKLISNIKSELENGYNHLMCQSPTGSGKTVMFSYIAQNSSRKGKKILIITDRMELLSQAGGTLEQFSINHAYIKAGAKTINKKKSTYVAMAQTLRNRINIPEWADFIKNHIDLFIIDEAHIQEFNYLFESGLLEKKMVLGFTATPIRAGKMRQLGLDYDKIIRGEYIKELVKDRYLLNCDIYDFGGPDLSDVSYNYMKGDYSAKDMFKKYNTTNLYQGLIKNYQKVVDGQKMIVFCCNVEHAINTTIQLNNNNLSAKFICSQKAPPKSNEIMSNAQSAIYQEKLRLYELYKKYFDLFSGPRKEIFEDFKNNKFKILVNVEIATKGYDCPDIKVVALCRATTSLALYLQMIGRGSRISKGKTHFTVLDFGENKARFGSYDAPREWDLWHEEKKGGGVPPMKYCGISEDGEELKGDGFVDEGCERLILAAYRICPFCGFKYPKKDPRKEVDLLLSSIKDKNGISLKMKPFRKMTHEELYKYREIKNHKIAWLWHQLWNRGKEKELIKFANTYRWSKNYIDSAVRYCKSIYN